MTFFRYAARVVFVFMLSLLVTQASGTNTLDCARSLALAYKDYTYGTGPNKIDCTSFVLKVVECRLGEKLPAEARKAVLIDYGWSVDDIQTKAAAATEPKLAGVQYALTAVLKKGKAILPSDAKPGDLIQYWIQKTDGTWFGHAAVITKMDGAKATILGAHQSMNKVAELNEQINLTGANRRIYIVRLE